MTQVANSLCAIMTQLALCAVSVMTGLPPSPLLCIVCSSVVVKKAMMPGCPLLPLARLDQGSWLVLLMKIYYLKLDMLPHVGGVL